MGMRQGPGRGSRQYGAGALCLELGIRQRTDEKPARGRGESPELKRLSEANMIDKNYDPMRETGLNFDDESDYRGAMTKALIKAEASDAFGGLLDEMPIVKSAKTT